MLYLSVNDPSKAIELTDELTSDGAKYIHALALASMGKVSQATKYAEAFAKSYFDPMKSYFAANIFLAAKKPELAKEIFLSPRTRLAADYGLFTYASNYGLESTPPSFNLDLFKEYTFGHFDSFSFAPPANAYVELATAKSLIDTNKTKEARNRLDILIRHPLSQPYREVLWSAHYELSLLHREEGNTEKSIQHLEEALEIIETIRASLATEAGRIGFSRNKIDVYGDLVSIYIEGDLLDKAFETVERAKGRALVDLLSRHSDLIPVAATTESEVALYQEMAVQDQNVAMRGSKSMAALTRYTNARKNLIKRAPHLASLVSVPPVNYDALRNQLREKESGILFQQFGDILHIFSFNHQDIAYSSTSASNLSNDIKEFRLQLTDIGSNNFLTLSNKLYETLIRPHEEILLDRVIIAPTDSLFYLPFSALHDGQEYFGSRYSLNIVPSFNVYSMIRPSKGKFTNVLLMGNPDRHDPTLDLPGAEHEVNVISTMVPNSHLLIRDAATEEAFFKNASKFDIVHIAGHGQFSDANPLQSRLLLAPSNSSDGDVTVEELYGLRTKAKIVVLSACETALGSISKGDELVGMLRGFLYGGAKGIVGSLWQVEDNSTALLMQSFYKNLNQGIDPVVALHVAQNDVKNRYHHPYFWSAFQFTGR
jgi:CHAT domain-containing protein